MHNSRLKFFIEHIISIKKIQKTIRGFLYRIKHLPNVMRCIQKYLNNINFKCTTKNNDGRINSSDDEILIIQLLKKKFGDRIKIGSVRMWYDFIVYDYIYGWLPINIKTTTLKTCDNTGNLTMCVYAYTDEKLNFDTKYTNGCMSKLLIEKIKNKQYNHNYKKTIIFWLLIKKIIKFI